MDCERTGPLLGGNLRPKQVSRQRTAHTAFVVSCGQMMALPETRTDGSQGRAWLSRDVHARTKQFSSVGRLAQYSILRGLLHVACSISGCVFYLVLHVDSFRSLRTGH